MASVKSCYHVQQSQSLMALEMDMLLARLESRKVFKKKIKSVHGQVSVRVVRCRCWGLSLVQLVAMHCHGITICLSMARQEVPLQAGVS